MKRANSGLTWIQQPHVTEFLQQLATEPVITHARLDELPASRTREYVRGLLVEHNALPRRDELSTRFSDWAEQALDRITSPSHRDITRRYIRWHHQRRMNQMDEVTRGTFLRAKQAVTVAIELQNWLSDQGTELAELNQAHLDRWQAEGHVKMAEAVTLAKIAGTEQVDRALGDAALYGRFAHGDLASILNANVRRTTTHAADETRSLTQGTSAWAGLGAAPSTTTREQNR